MDRIDPAPLVFDWNSARSATETPSCRSYRRSTDDFARVVTQLEGRHCRPLEFRKQGLSRGNAGKEHRMLIGRNGPGQRVDGRVPAGQLLVPVDGRDRDPFEQCRA